MFNVLKQKFVIATKLLPFWLQYTLTVLLLTLIAQQLVARASNIIHHVITNQPEEVIVQSAQIANMPTHFIAHASLLAAEKQTLLTPVAREVQSIYFAKGDEVDRDDPLIQFDDTIAKEKLQSKQRDFERSLKQLEDSKLLYELGGVHPVKYKSLVEKVAEEEQATKHSLVTLKHSAIRATVHGVIDQIFVKPGNIAQPQQPLITLASLELLRASYRLPKRYSPLFVKEAGARVNVAEHPDEGFWAVIESVKENKEHSYATLTALVNNGAKLLWPGMHVSFTHILASRACQLVVPISALMSDFNGISIFKVVDGRVVLNYLSLGERLGDKIAVEYGIERGDMIVTDWHRDLHDGDRVTVTQTKAPLQDPKCIGL